MAKKFDRTLKKFIEDENDVKERVEIANNNDLLYQHLGFTKRYRAISYEESKVFPDKMANLYTEQSLEQAKQMVSEVFSKLSVGVLDQSFLIDLKGAIEPYLLAFVALRLMLERGKSVSPLVTSLDCERLILSSHAVVGDKYSEVEDAECVVILVNGASPVSYVKSIYTQRILRGKNTIIILDTRVGYKTIMQDLVKSDSNPDGCVLITAEERKDIDVSSVYYENSWGYTQDYFKDIELHIPNMNMTGDKQANSGVSNSQNYDNNVPNNLGFLRADEHSNYANEQLNLANNPTFYDGITKNQPNEKSYPKKTRDDGISSHYSQKSNSEIVLNGIFNDENKGKMPSETSNFWE